MKKPVKFLFVIGLPGASLLAVCGQAATPNADQQAVNVPPDAERAQEKALAEQFLGHLP